MQGISEKYGDGVNLDAHNNEKDGSEETEKTLTGELRNSAESMNGAIEGSEALDSAPKEDVPESPAVEQDIEERAFEAYVKELRQKYPQEGRPDWPQVDQGCSELHDETASPAREAFAGPNERASVDPMQQFANLDAQQAAESPVNAAPLKTDDSGRYQHKEVDESKDMSGRTTPTDSERAADSDSNAFGPEKVQPASAEKTGARMEKPPRVGSIGEGKLSSDESTDGQQEKGEPVEKSNSKDAEPATPRVIPSKPELERHAGKITCGGELSEKSQDVLFVGHEKKSGEGNYLPIPKKYLAAYGREDILEARVTRAADPDKEFVLYTSPAFVDSHINIFHLKPSPHETFRVLSLERYEFPDFARDFNKHKPEEFQNVKLSISDGRMMMKVDTNLVEIKQPRLVSEGGFVAMEGVLVENKPTGRIRIAKEFDRFDMHFRDASTNHPRILSMKAVGSRIEVWHRNSRYEFDHRTRWIPSQSLELRDRIGERIEKSRLLGLDTSNMTKKEIRAWIDTEGCLYVPRAGSSSSPRLDCSQKRREPLEAYVKGVEELTGVVPKIQQANKHGQLVAIIDDVEGIARVISAVGPFRAPQRVDQVRRFMKFLTREREAVGRRRVVERASKLLGL